jgi:oligopeptide transport system substrate-binding protein
MNKANMPRRTFLAGSSAVLAACHSADGEYFGNTTPPRGQRLVFENNSEPETLDPAKSNAGPEYYLLPSLFEGLVTPHPTTLEPLAGMATHYEAAPDFTWFRFYLRGHPNPRGRRLGDFSSVLPKQVSPKLVPPDDTPAHWSDGAMVTAHDFVRSWRRVLAPETTAGFGVSYLYYIKGAKEINLGKAAPETLGVKTPDLFALDICLQSPAPFFLALLWVSWFCPVPARPIEAARKQGLEQQWTDPRNIAVNGPFTLAEWRPNQGILLRKNRRYYATAAVLLEEVLVLPTREEQTIVNLYKSGYSHAMRGNLLTHKRDLLRAPAVSTSFYSMNSTRPPFNQFLFRYALNMALDKDPITAYLSGGQKPARGFVPPALGLVSLTSLPVEVQGRSYDLLKFDPAGARDLLAKAGYSGGVQRNGNRLAFTLTSSARPRSAKTAEILQRQWREHLGIDVRLSTVTESVWVATLTNKQYDGMIEDLWSAVYLDPNDFLSLFVAPAIAGATWSDPQFEALLQRANAAADSASRFQKLAESETYLMRSMPIVPLYFESYSCLQKPFVRGFDLNLGNIILFKYAWIDPHWRAA